jgi:hypothetical protein
MAHNWYARCLNCDKWLLKRDMKAICIRDRFYSYQTIGFLCPICLSYYADELGVEIK